LGKAYEFAKSLLPSLENNLKSVVTNPLNSSAGPLEGYIAVAVLLGPLSQTKKFSKSNCQIFFRNTKMLISIVDDIISRNAAINSITASTTKPSFLLWEKVYQKVTESEDEKWLLRACDAALSFFKSDFSKNEALRYVLYEAVITSFLTVTIHRSQLGLVFVHLALEGSSPAVRRDVHTAIVANTTRQPQLTNRVIRDALNTFLSRGTPTTLKPGAADEEPKPWNKHARLSSLLSGAVSFDDDLELGVREDMIVELVILGHHHLICMDFKSLILLTLLTKYVQVEIHGKHGSTCARKHEQTPEN
jgi:hypothetical protein